MTDVLKHRYPARRAPDLSGEGWKRAVYCGRRPLLLLCAGLGMGSLLLLLAVGPYSWRILPGYMAHWETLVLNIAPPALLALGLYGITERAWLSFLISGVIFAGLALGNYYKLYFRSDPLYLEDLFRLREASEMAGGGHYRLFLDRNILLVLAGLVLGAVLLRLLAPGRLRERRYRLAAIVPAAAAALFLLPVYLDTAVYDAVDNYDLLNRWNPSQNYIAHGFVYPFLHSITGFAGLPPEGYQAAKAEEILSAYQDADIPPDRRINIIAVMREAYVDFSRYGVEGLDPASFELYHQLEAESYTGDLVTNIFGGGTVDTERCFLTGNYDLKNFRCNANSYLWYLREQGYTVEGSHPYYQWFYNRQNVNGYLGFERYRFLEGDYERLTGAALPEDAVLYPEVYADFEANKSSGKPYFSFVVNVQSHGPYSTDSCDAAFLTGYGSACRNAMNHYLSSIHDSDVQLMKFIDKLRADPAPVVLVTFGDHLPWMGDNAEFYDEMGIDIDPGTDSGFIRHYSTRYLIWANAAAEEILGHKVAGSGPRISPCYLMGLLFRQLGWKGPAYMQALDGLMEVFPVVTTTGRYVVDGVLTGAVPEERLGLFRDFRFLQKYWRDEWLYGRI